MNKIKLICDSLSDIPKELLETYDIHEVPLTIIFDGKEYIDGIDLSKEECLRISTDFNPGDCLYINGSERYYINVTDPLKPYSPYYDLVLEYIDDIKSINTALILYSLHGAPDAYLPAIISTIKKLSPIKPNTEATSNNLFFVFTFCLILIFFKSSLVASLRIPFRKTSFNMLWIII